MESSKIRKALRTTMNILSLIIISLLIPSGLRAGDSASSGASNGEAARIKYCEVQTDTKRREAADAGQDTSGIWYVPNTRDASAGPCVIWTWDKDGIEEAGWFYEKAKSCYLTKYNLYSITNVATTNVKELELPKNRQRDREYRSVIQMGYDLEKFTEKVQNLKNNSDYDEAKQLYDKFSAGYRELCNSESYAPASRR